MNNSFWLIFLWKAIGTEADPGIFDWGVQTLVQKGLLNFFVANYFSQRLPRVAQSVNTRRRWRGKYCFASRGEQISQLKSHLRSCRCKNFSLKQASGWIGGVRTPRTLPLDPPLRYSMNTYPGDMWLSTLEIGAAQPRSVTKTAPKFNVLKVWTEALSGMVFVSTPKLSGNERYSVKVALGFNC